MNAFHTFDLTEEREIQAWLSYMETPSIPYPQNPHSFCKIDQAEEGGLVLGCHF